MLKYRQTVQTEKSLVSETLSSLGRRFMHVSVRFFGTPRVLLSLGVRWYTEHYSGCNCGPCLSRGGRVGQEGGRGGEARTLRASVL